MVKNIRKSVDGIGGVAGKGGAKGQCLKYCRFSGKPIRLMKVY